MHSVMPAKSKTVHVYPSGGAWAVKSEGRKVELFHTRREALKAARINVKKADSGQLAVHSRDGRIKEHETYRMPAIQDPPKRSRLAKLIGRAVGTLALKRVKSGSNISSASPIKK